MMLPGATAQSSPPLDIKALMEQLTKHREVRSDTVRQIVALSKKDREFVIQRLPDLIRGPESDLWLNAMRTAGELKAKEAVPALQDVLSRPPHSAEAFMTFSGTTRLDNDIVAKALADIGDPSVPTAKSLLKAKDDSAGCRGHTDPKKHWLASGSQGFERATLARKQHRKQEAH